MSEEMNCLSIKQEMNHFKELRGEKLFNEGNILKNNFKKLYNKENLI